MHLHDTFSLILDWNVNYPYYYSVPLLGIKRPITAGRYFHFIDFFYPVKQFFRPFSALTGPGLICGGLIELA